MNNTELTAHIVASQCKPMSTEEIVESIKAIHATLVSLEAPAETLPEPKDSIRNHDVICLECGRSFKLLSNRHLTLHGLTPRAYKQKHGIPLTQPLSAKTLTRKRQATAKASGLGAALAQWRAAKDSRGA